MSKDTEKKPASGLNSMKFTSAFKMSNFELFAKPNKIVMTVGLACFGLALSFDEKDI